MKAKLFFILLLFNNSVSAQIQLQQARDMAMGNASVAVPTEGIASNIALTIANKKSYLSFGASNKYFVKDLSLYFISIAKTFKNDFSIVASIARTGNQSFSEQYIEGGIAKKLGQNFFAGIKLHYHQWILSESKYEGSNALIPEVSFYCNPYKKLSFGILIRNPVRSQMNAVEQNKLPAQINSGISYRLSEKIILACAINHQSDQPASYGFGFEYVFHPRLFLRGGFHTLPLSQSFGFGIKMSKLQLDVGMNTHPLLGNSTAISLTIPL